jgi:CheY-like chemotaxis protein
MNTNGKPCGRNEKLIRVVFADDSTPVRSILRRCIAMIPGLQLVGVAADGCEALELISLQQPDVALIDLHMPRLNGLQTTALVRELHPNIRILLISVDDSEPVVATCLAQGADAFVSKRRLWRDLCRGMATVFPTLQPPANGFHRLADPGVGQATRLPLLSGRAGQPARIYQWTIPVEERGE